MQTFTLVTLLLCSAVSYAAPLVGYSTMEPANLYQIKNAQTQTIYSATADTVKRVELRDGFAVVQTTSNNVSLITEDQKTVVDAIFGSEFLVSKGLLAVFTPNGIGSVYTLGGTKLFPAVTDSQTRMVREIHIANDHFAVVDRITNVLSVFNAQGNEVFRSRDSKLVMISDRYLVTKSVVGTVSLYNLSEMSESFTGLITTDSNVSSIQISDEFAGYIDRNGNLRLFSSEGEFAPFNQVKGFSLTNTFAIVNDSFGLTLYGKDKSTLETTNSIRSFSTSHELFAYTTIAGALIVKNEATGDSMIVSRAAAYQMSDDLLIVKNGIAEFTVYSLEAGSFGKAMHSALDQTITQSQVGNGVVSFQTNLQSGASNRAKVLSFTRGAMKSVLVDETPVNRINLSVNREELNWK